jgi:hypothetical protein
MASCKCGGGACNCVVVEGPGASVEGAGSTTTPYVVGAKVSPAPGNTISIDSSGGLYAAAGAVDCDDVRPCLSAGPGVTYDPATGVIGADVSPTPGNTLSIDTGGLFVPPAAAAALETGCGLTGDGTTADPLRTNTAAAPAGCPEDSLPDVVCRSDGSLAAPPEKHHVSVDVIAQPSGSSCLRVNDLAPDDGVFHTIATGVATLTNPSDCLPMKVRIEAGVRHAQYVAHGPGDNEVEIGVSVNLSGAITGPRPQLVAHQHWRVENVGDGDRQVFDSVGAYDADYVTLGPGETITITMDGTLFNAISSPTACLNTPKFRLFAEGVNE